MVALTASVGFSVRVLATVLVAAACTVRASPLEKRAADPTVTLPSGVIIGTATSVSNQPTQTNLVSAYLGVPFAAVPTGSLRFAPPVAHPAWSKPRYAQKLKRQCLQLFGGGEPEHTLVRYYFEDPEGTPVATSEDCLYLNVYAPPGARQGSNLPVLFWLFGGDLEFGSAAARYYNASSLAVNENVIVVAINFRNNVFGFSNSPEMPPGQANVGFLDQRFALQWVQENIPYFGGDPTRVTLFGVSAGAESIKQLMANPPSPAPFHAAILQSAGGIVVSNGTGSWKNLTIGFKCDTAPSPLNCMRQIPGRKIVRYMTQQDIHFPPVIDGVTYVADPTASFNSGRFSKIPTLIGTNKNEATILIASTGITNGTQVLEMTLKNFGIDNPSVIAGLWGIFPSIIANSPFDLAAAVGTDIVYTCLNSIFADQLHNNGNLVWRYQYMAYFPNTQWFSGAKAYHSSEVSQVFGSYPITTQFGTVTQQQIELSAYMQKTWANFAANPSAGPGWNPIQANFFDTMGFIGSSSAPTGASVASIAMADASCPFWSLTGATSPFSF